MIRQLLHSFAAMLANDVIGLILITIVLFDPIPLDGGTVAGLQFFLAALLSVSVSTIVTSLIFGTAIKEKNYRFFLFLPISYILSLPLILLTMKIYGFGVRIDLVTAEVLGVAWLTSLLGFPGYGVFKKLRTNQPNKEPQTTSASARV